jgi:hypothetical protein
MDKRFGLDALRALAIVLVVLRVLDAALRTARPHVTVDRSPRDSAVPSVSS